MIRGFAFFLALVCSVYSQEISRGDRLDIKTADGKTYEKAKVMEITPTALVVINSGGVFTLPKSQLPAEFSARISWPAPPAPQPKPETVSPTPVFVPRPTYVPPAPTPVAASRDVIVPMPTVRPDLSPLTPHSGEVTSTLLSSKLYGQCFIVTRGGTNYKLGDVTISVYPKEAYYWYTSQVSKRSRAFNAEWDPYQEDRSNRKDYAASIKALDIMISYSAKLHEMIPAAAYFTTTDADGRYEIEHKVAKPYVVIAHASREVGDKTEKYKWVIDSDEISENGQLMLTNRNLQ